MLENVPAAGLRAPRLRAVPEPDALRTVLIKAVRSCRAFPSSKIFRRWNGGMCAAARRWPRCGIPRARPRCGLAVTDCKKLRDISGWTGAAALSTCLQVQRLEPESWRALRPSVGLRALRTLDLGCRGAKDKVKLDFNMLYPQLDSLTIRPA